MSAPTVNADPRTTNTAILAMLLIADSPCERPLTDCAFRNRDIIRAYPGNQLTRCNHLVNRGDGTAQICLSPHEFARFIRDVGWRSQHSMDDLELRV
jgi:hypothetical protein